ncbi:hypothetical protein [Nocardiopsis kunsanensis]|uniref:hypothetical protein n=1 Tax=Nocardiopsis kunsanensis TaxID=141693 RepID=UPI000344EEF1|nr:hypothetical protein [Nocardiopsis kunsanensis]
MAAITEWAQQVLHRECDTVIDYYDRARQASASAHHEAEQALAAERERVARLEGALAAHQARADRAEAALARSDRDQGVGA